MLTKYLSLDIIISSQCFPGFRQIHSRLRRSKIRPFILLFVMTYSYNWKLFIIFITYTFLSQHQSTTIRDTIQCHRLSTVTHRLRQEAASEPMLVSLLTNICVTRPQWVNLLCCIDKNGLNIKRLRELRWRECVLLFIYSFIYWLVGWGWILRKSYINIIAVLTPVPCWLCGQNESLITEEWLHLPMPFYFYKTIEMQRYFVLPEINSTRPW